MCDIKSDGGPDPEGDGVERSKGKEGVVWFSPGPLFQGFLMPLLEPEWPVPC